LSPGPVDSSAFPYVPRHIEQAVTKALTKDPCLANIRGEERFKKLMERVKYEWEHFEA
jgi:hypothetical protein